MKKITREELDQVLQHHKLWLDSDGANGKLADLRGAHFLRAELWNIDLRDAKLDVNIRDCYGFAGAKFTPDALPWLILHPRWPELKDTVQIKPE